VGVHPDRPHVAGDGQTIVAVWDDEPAHVTPEPAAPHRTTARALRRAAGTLRSQVREHERKAGDAWRGLVDQGHHRSSASDFDMLARTLADGAPWTTHDEAERVVWVLTPEDAADLLDAGGRATDERDEDARHGTGAFTPGERDELEDAAVRLRALVERLATS